MSLVDHASVCQIWSLGRCTCGASTSIVVGGGGSGQFLPITAFVHPKAHVEDAKIGARTKVWQFASVIRGTVLGEDCTVAAGACLDGPVLGDRCIVSPGVDIGPGFKIGNDVFLGPNVVLCNDGWPTVDKTGWDAEDFRSGRIISVVIEDGASVGANAVILPGVTIGKGAMVAAGAVCDRDVPAGHLFKRSGKVVEINTAWAKQRRVRAVRQPAEALRVEGRFEIRRAE